MIGPNSLGGLLNDFAQRRADVRDAIITGYEGNGIYDCQLIDTGGTILARAKVGTGQLAIGTQCTVAPMAAGGAANAPWWIIDAETQKVNLPTVPPPVVPIGSSIARILAQPTILTAGGAAVDVVIEGTDLAAGPTYGDPGIIDWIAPDVTSTRVTAHVKALATVAQGTISTTGTNVVGVGTNATHFASGQLIIIGAYARRFDVITDDTHFTIDSALPTDVSDVAYAVGYPITEGAVTIADFFQVIASPAVFPVLYGVASATGAHDGGTLFKFDNADNSVTALYSFDTTVDSAWSPVGPAAIVGREIYFCCSTDAGSGFGTIFKFNLDTSVLTLVHAFAGTDGSGLYAGLLKVGAMLYGVADGGGANSAGVLFKIDPASDTFTSLHDFDPSVSGKSPTGLTYDGAKMYGVTFSSFGPPATVFSVDPGTDTLTVLYSYDSTYYGSFGSPHLESANSFDGDTIYIVSQTAGTDNVGCIDSYVISTNTWTRVVEFTAAGDMGSRPEGPLTKVDSVYYGNANGGGTSSDGTIFKFNPSGPTLTAVTQFTGANGRSPARGGLLLFASKLWIVTPDGGTDDIGVVGQVNPADDSYTLLHEFVAAEGSYPFTGLVAAP